VLGILEAAASSRSLKVIGFDEGFLSEDSFFSRGSGAATASASDIEVEAP
jgi:hypothetical protein